jgi:hypothetical protein
MMKGQFIGRRKAKRITKCEGQHGDSRGSKGPAPRYKTCSPPHQGSGSLQTLPTPQVTLPDLF